MHIGSPWVGSFLILQMAVNFYTASSHGTGRTVTHGSRLWHAQWLGLTDGVGFQL